MTDWFEKDWSMVNCLYFGVWVGSGHRFVTPGGFKIKSVDVDQSCPWSVAEIENKLCPDSGTQRQFEAKLHHKSGWTAIAFWDRSGDPRMNSKSVFMVEGDYTFAECVEIMCRKFPKIISRMRTTPILAS